MATISNANATNANYLSKQTGLNPSVSYAWLSQEGQSTDWFGVNGNPTNPLNIECGNGPGQTSCVSTPGGRSFGVYPSVQAGLDSAAYMIKSYSWATGIRTAIASGSPVAQAQAIDTSKWGTSGVTKALAAAEQKMLPGTGTGVATPGTSPVLTTDQWNAVIADLPSGTRYISTTNIPLIEAAAAKQGLDLSNIDWSKFTAINPATGHPSSLSDLRDYLISQGSIPAVDISGGTINAATGAANTIISDAQKILGDIPAFIVLVFGGICILGGVFMIYKDTSSGSSTNTVISQRTVPIVYRGSE